MQAIRLIIILVQFEVILELKLKENCCFFLILPNSVFKISNQSTETRNPFHASNAIDAAKKKIKVRFKQSELVNH